MKWCCYLAPSSQLSIRLEELGVFSCFGLTVLKEVYFPKERWQEIQAYLTGIRETDSRIRLIVKGGSAGTPLSLIFEFGNNLKYQQKQLQFQLLHYLLYNALESCSFKGLFLCSTINFMNTFLSSHHVFPLCTTKTSAFRLPKKSCKSFFQNFRDKIFLYFPGRVLDTVKFY